ncbi:MAG: hypothetical protein JNK12_00525 [Acidimicrobiales bacterium]|nr:hypothetical protein [Acidimicrobiales bacterium]
MARWLAGALVAASAVLGFVLLTAGAASADEPATGTITVVLDASPDDGQDVSFTGCKGQWCGPMVLDDDADPTRSNTTTADLEPGTYTVTQDAVPNWTLSALTCDTGETTSLASRRATIDLTAGEDVTCTFTNTSASITIIQDSSPDDARDFSFTGCLGSGCADFALDDDADGTLPRRQSSAGLAPGTYTVTQAADATWALTSITCTTGESVSLGNRRVTITLSADEQTTCTFTNQAASITVIQDTSPDDAQDFSFDGCMGSGCAPFVLDDDADPEHPSSITAVGLAPGSYRVWSTTDEPNWPRTNLTCSSGSVWSTKSGVDITLVPGRQVTCTFRNDYSTESGSLELEVDTQPDGPVDITMHRCGDGGCADVVLDDDARPDRDRYSGRAALPAGWYSVTVDPVPEHELSSIDCGSNDRNVDIDAGTFEVAVRPGSQSRCTVTHRRPLPRLEGVVDVSAGMQSTCARLTTGRVRCWGDQETDTGQLGTGNAGDSTTPEEVAGVGGAGVLDDVVDVSVGFSHACAVVDSGEARCWGYNSRGTLGDGTTSVRRTPVAVSNASGSGPLTGVTTVGTGGNVSCALLRSSEVHCWGGNSDGELGDGTTTDHPRPAAVSDPDGLGPLTGARALTVGLFHACTLMDGGTVSCWGANNRGQSGDGTTTQRVRPGEVLAPNGPGVLEDVVQVSAGHQHTCAVLTSTQVRCWGRNGAGELGDGTQADRSRPVTVSNGDGTGPLTGVRSVHAGGEKTCALLIDGSLSCWGTNGDGLLGTGSTSDVVVRPEPVLDETGAGVLDDVVAVTVSRNSACAVLTDGQARCWGGSGGLLGDGTETPRARPTLVVDPLAQPAITGVSQIDANEYLACASGSGQLRCWGHGALGNPDAVVARSAVEIRDSEDSDGLSGAHSVSVGAEHACAAMDDGGVRCWGSNESRQLGDGTALGRQLPASVVGVGGIATLGDVVAVSAGMDRTCALLDSGEARCWGENSRGELGDGGTTDRATPVAVLDETGTTPLTGITQLSARGPLTCALLDSGQVRCWGNNHVLPAPLPDVSGVGPLTGVAQIDAGCATLANGEARCWTSSVLDSSTPTVVPSPSGAGPLTGVQSISRSSDVTCALLTAGQVACWSASNAYGQLGTLPPATTGRPTLVLDPDTGEPVAGATGLATRTSGACLTRDGGVWCWGFGYLGTLGDGTDAIARFRPSAVRTPPG